MTGDAATTAQGERRLDRQALVTFVLAAVWLFGAGSLLALYVGRRSLRRLRIDQELVGRTLAWAGIAVAVFGIVMAGLWIGLSFSA